MSRCILRKDSSDKDGVWLVNFFFCSPPEFHVWCLQSLKTFRNKMKFSPLWCCYRVDMQKQSGIGKKQKFWGISSMKCNPTKSSKTAVKQLFEELKVRYAKGIEALGSLHWEKAKCIAVLPDLTCFSLTPLPLTHCPEYLFPYCLCLTPCLQPWWPFLHFRFPWAFLLQHHIPVGSAAGVWHRLAGCQLWQRAIENRRRLFVPYRGIWDLQENHEEILLFHSPSSV